MLGRWPDTSVIHTNVKERNAVFLAVITPVFNPVRSSRLHTLILEKSVRETRRVRVREDRQQTGEWHHYLGDGGRKDGRPLVLVCEQRPVAFPVYINVLILN